MTPLPRPHARINTHAPGQGLSRIGRFRLRYAEFKRDEAIAHAHEAYREEVRAILGQDRLATRELATGHAANLHPWRWNSLRWPGTALFTPLAHALRGVRSAAHMTPADLLALVRGGRHART